MWVGQQHDRYQLLGYGVVRCVMPSKRPCPFGLSSKRPVSFYRRRRPLGSNPHIRALDGDLRPSGQIAPAILSGLRRGHSLWNLRGGVLNDDYAIRRRRDDAFVHWRNPAEEHVPVIGHVQDSRTRCRK